MATVNAGAGVVPRAEGIAAALRARIGGGKLRAGQHLVEADLVAEFGASRGSVREAMRLLVAEGLLHFEPNRGVSVRRLSRGDILSLYEVRGALEGLAARLVAARGGDMARLCAANEDGRSAVRARNAGAYAAANQVLHWVVVEMSGNALLVETASRLRLQAARMQVQALADPTAMRASQSDHDRIVAAICRGQADAAERAMRSHIARGLRIALALDHGDDVALGALSR